MENSQTPEAEAGPGLNQNRVDRAYRDDVESQALPEKPESTSTPETSNLASVHITDVLALKDFENIQN